jgi:hypothetical protein
MRGLRQCGVEVRVEAAKVLLKPADDQGVVGAGSKTALNLFADHQILGIEHDRIDQLERAAPMLFSPVTRRLLRDEHRVHEKRLVGALRVYAEVANVVCVWLYGFD